MKKFLGYFIALIFVLGLTGACMETCEDSNHSPEDVEYFLSKGPSVESAVRFAREAMSREDYSASHRCIDYLRSSENLWLHRELYCKLRADVYSEEFKYMLSNDPYNSMVKIKVLLSDLVPTITKPSIGTDISSNGDGGWENFLEYKEEAMAYNTVLGKLVDLLLVLDMAEEAKEFANKGLEIPIQDTKNEIISGYSDDDAKTIANKVRTL